MKKKVKKTIRSSIDLDQSYKGTEPTWDDSEPSNLEIGTALSWYSYFYDIKRSVKEFIENYPERPNAKNEIKQIKRLQPWRVNSTICHLQLMQTRGCKLPQAYIENIHQHIDDILKIKEFVAEEETKPKKVVSIQDRTLEKNRAICAQIDQEFDRFYFENKFKSDFKTYNFLQTNQVKPVACNYIINVYKEVREDFELALAKDEELSEAYSHLKPAQLKRVLKFIDEIIDDCTAWASNQKKTRKPRKKKEVTAENQLAKFNYCKEFTELKLASIRPEEVIGAQQLWIYNTKYKVLSRLDCATSKGFTVKGTTIQDVDNTSIGKALRKPKEILPRVLDGGKIILRKIFNEINTKEKQPTGRINADIILLRAIK